MGSRRFGWSMWVALLAWVVVCGQSLPAAETSPCVKCCFEDVIVVGSSVWWLDTPFEFIGELWSGAPRFGFAEYAGPIYWGGVAYYASDPGWQLWVQIIEPVGCLIGYRNPSTSFLPPRTGWTLALTSGSGCDEIAAGVSSSLTLSGGESCGGTLVPAGATGFLDRGWPEGEEPPEIGELVLSATYEIGEPITGCCAVEDGTGNPLEVPYVILAWYSVAIGEDFDARTALDVQSLRVDSLTGAYCFAIPTAELAPGYYDIRLGIPFGDYQWIRVEVVAPTE